MGDLIHLYCISLHKLEGRMEIFLFNDAFTFYLQLYGIGRMVEDHSKVRENLLLPLYGLFL